MKEVTKENMVNGESSELLPKSSASSIVADENKTEDEFATYKRRWWVLFVFCLCNSNQSLLWNTWSPIANTVEAAFEWPLEFAALVLAVSAFSSTIMAFPCMYIIERSNLRVGVLISAAFLVLCSACWLVSLATQQTWLLLVGSTMNGVTGAITMAAPSLVSVKWFPTSERTIATSFAALSGYVGNAMSFVTGPYISGGNATLLGPTFTLPLPYNDVLELKFGVSHVLYFGAMISFTGFALAVIYFPANPPKPPTEVQTKPREKFSTGLKKLLTNPNFWLLNMAYNISNGIFNAWLPLCSISFRPLGVDEVTSGWIGFTAIMASCVSSIFISKAVEKVKRKLKLVLQLSNIAAFVMLLITACIQQGYILVPNSLIVGVLYGLSIGMSLVENGVIPLYYELACDCTFPVDEGLTCALMSSWNNLFAFVFYMFWFSPYLAANTEWMTWTCVGACALAVPMLHFMKEHYYRLDIDTHIIEE